MGKKFCEYILSNAKYSYGFERPVKAVAWSEYGAEYFEILKSKYKLEEKVSACGNSEYQKVTEITKWVTNLWSHDGANTPVSDDPLSILDEVTEQGKNFRCVEYGRVIHGCLCALNIPARVLGLMTRDAETRDSGAGHVAVEVYLKDLRKWVFVDGQYGITVSHCGVPLNAAELGATLDSAGDEIKNGLSCMILREESAAITKKDYFAWIHEYLFYMNTSYVTLSEGGEKKLFQMMLTPVGSKNPEVFQKKYPLRFDVYTHSAADFYLRPDLKLVNPPSKTVENVHHKTFYSGLLKQDVGYNIYLPPGYGQSGKKYPVLYWLHGMGGNESSDISAADFYQKKFLAKYTPPGENTNDTLEGTQSFEMLIVFVNGAETSGYKNAADGSLPMESIIIEELLPHIDSAYRTTASRSGRAVEGFSMGGHGALYFAAKYPELFCSAVAYACAYSFGKITGDAKTSANSIPYWINKNADALRGGSHIRLVIGDKDFLFEGNEAAHSFLTSMGVPHEYEVEPGVDHNLGVLYERYGEKGLLFHFASMKKV
ncbi:MAG: alpha/beta hydrolase-fold protein [Defluviitaleaceae bacterium]|nr:alpha/beta hydrolase-fold protein [Defluviitaleaceae bacterium]